MNITMILPSLSGGVDRAFGYQPSTGFVACGNRVEMVLLQKPGVLFELLSPKVKTTVNHRF